MNKKIGIERIVQIVVYKLHHQLSRWNYCPNLNAPNAPIAPDSQFYEYDYETMLNTPSDANTPDFQ